MPRVKNEVKLAAWILRSWPRYLPKDSSNKYMVKGK